MQNKTGEIIVWLGLADDDYLAARTLLRQGLVVPGSILSASAIEKYLKTVHLIHNKPFETFGKKAHDVYHLYKNLEDHLYKEKPLNESYLRALNKAFRLRYPDRLEKEFSIALHQGKMLVGLDETVFKIRNRIKFQGAERPFKFDLMIKENDPHLMQGNYAFGIAKRGEAFSQPLVWYEMRVLENGAWLQVYNPSTATDDNEYNLDGLRHGDSDKQFILQAPALDPTTKEII